MRPQSKLTLSDEELQLVSSTGWILTKHAVTSKLYDLFGELSEKYKVVCRQEWLPAAATGVSPKISKGENYLRLPYVMLDFPRLFDQQNVFAVRTLFWWGNFFSITLHLSGEYKKRFEKKLLAGFDIVRRHDFYVCTGADPWQHHFEHSNYIPAAGLAKEEFEKTMLQKPFIKLAAKFPVQAWNDMPELLEEKFILLMKLLGP